MPAQPAQAEQAEQAAQADLGIATVELTPTIRRQLRLNADVQGVVVNAVDPNSDAARKGISRGAVILMVGGAAVPNVQAFERAIDVAQRSGKEAVLLRVQPLGGRPPLFVPVRIQDE